MNADIETALATDRTIDITTIGARTGEPRRIEIWYLHIAGRFFITGTPGPRHWLANLTACPDFTFHLKESVRADLAATAVPVSDLATRELVFDHPVAEWYRGQADRDELVERAPMVEITFAS